MQLLITCDFKDGTQVLVKNDATEADLAAVRRAMDGDPAHVLSIACSVMPAPNAAPKERLIRAGAIRTVDIERP